jgi:curli production assembly/transport component CsgG
VREAIEAAVVHLVVEGLQEGNWELKDEKERSNPLLREYAKEQLAYGPDSGRYTS